MKSRLLYENQGEKTFVLVLETGDEVVAELKAFARERRLAGSRFTAIGAFEEATLGYFDWQRKDYKRISVREQVEVVSLIGDVTEGEKGETGLHAHVVVGRSDGSTLAGHLLEARVRPTLELMITETPTQLRRRHDPESGLALISL